jgi:hypothetical protein
MKCDEGESLHLFDTLLIPPQPPHLASSSTSAELIVALVVSTPFVDMLLAYQMLHECLENEAGYF